MTHPVIKFSVFFFLELKEALVNSGIPEEDITVCFCAIKINRWTFFPVQEKGKIDHYFKGMLSVKCAKMSMTVDGFDELVTVIKSIKTMKYE